MPFFMFSCLRFAAPFGVVVRASVLAVGLIPRGGSVERAFHAQDWTPRQPFLFFREGVTAMLTEHESYRPPHLSPRQQEVLQRLLVGDAEKQVARRLNISTNTVHGYVKSIYQACNVNSRAELMALFIERDELQPLASISRDG
jgi:DNA-binding NarL/FixJ family response regulator